MYRVPACPVAAALKLAAHDARQAYIDGIRNRVTDDQLRALHLNAMAASAAYLAAPETT